MMESVLNAMSLSERDLITSILSSFFIVDYGYITAVNDDKTVNVTHAAKMVTNNGEELPATESDNIEVLTICGAGFSINWDYKPKDKVLLLGTKDYIESVADVENAEIPKAFSHYKRANLKAIPLCVFSDEAKVKITVEEGTINIECEQDANITAGGNVTAEAEGDVSIEAKGNATVKSQNTKLTGGVVEIGGTVAPTGQGALCGIPYCAYSGAPHTGKQTQGA